MRPNFHIAPGMPVTADMGRPIVLNYLLGPRGGRLGGNARNVTCPEDQVRASMRRR